MDIITIIAEQKIREAIENGEFDDLPLKGKPLNLEDNSGVPAHLRTAFKILQNAGIIPEEVQLKKEMNSLLELIGEGEQNPELDKLKKAYREKELKYNLLMERHRRRLRF